MPRFINTPPPPITGDEESDVEHANYDALGVNFLGALAGLLMRAGRACMSDAIYVAIEVEAPIGGEH